MELRLRRVGGACGVSEVTQPSYQHRRHQHGGRHAGEARRLIQLEIVQEPLPMRRRTGGCWFNRAITCSS